MKEVLEVICAIIITYAILEVYTRILNYGAMRGKKRTDWVLGLSENESPGDNTLTHYEHYRLGMGSDAFFIVSTLGRNVSKVHGHEKMAVLWIIKGFEDKTITLDDDPEEVRARAYGATK